MSNIPKMGQFPTPVKIPKNLQDPSRWKQVDASHLRSEGARGVGGIQQPASDGCHLFDKSLMDG